MRFTEFSIPESTQWMEKSDILFILDCKNLQAPFVSASIVIGNNIAGKDPLGYIIDRIHPDDQEEFNNLLNEKSIRPINQELRILDHQNNVLPFGVQRLTVNSNQNKVLLLGIMQRSKKTLKKEQMA